MYFVCLLVGQNERERGRDFVFFNRSFLLLSLSPYSPIFLLLRKREIRTVPYRYSVAVHFSPTPTSSAKVWELVKENSAMKKSDYLKVTVTLSTCLHCEQVNLSLGWWGKADEGNSDSLSMNLSIL